MNKLILKSFALVATLTLSATIAFAGDASQSDKISQCMPQKLEGTDRISLTSTQDQFIYVDFWASWCGPCKLSFPFLNELRDEFSDSGLKIVAISVDKDIKAAKKFISRNPANFTLGIDSSGTCPKVFDVKGMPSSYLIDKDGNILYEHQGFRPSDPEKIRQALTEIMGS